MIKRKDGRWQEQIKLPGMEKPKYFYGKTQREVQRKLAAWSVEREQEQAQAVQLCTIVEQWAERHRDEVEATSWGNYAPAVWDVLQWFQGREIGDIHPLDSPTAAGRADSDVGLRNRKTDCAVQCGPAIQNAQGPTSRNQRAAHARTAGDDRGRVPPTVRAVRGHRGLYWYASGRDTSPPMGGY